MGSLRERERFFEGRKVKLEQVCSRQRGKKLVYSGDTKVCDSLIEIAQDADLLIQDCTYFNSQGSENYGHSSVEDVAEILNRTGAKRVILTHISRRYKDENQLRKEVKPYPNVQVARDFMRVTV